MSDILIPGKTPWFIPFCCSCDEAAENFTIHAATDEYVDFEAQCHGQYEGKRIKAADLIARKHGQKVKCFERRQGFDSVR